MLAVNVLGVVHGIQAFMPHLMTAGAGHMVNIASILGLTTSPFGAAYRASKHAVVAVSETLQQELDVMGLPIGVTIAYLGLVRTPLAERLITLTQAEDNGSAGQLPADIPRQRIQQLRAAFQSLLVTVLEPEVAAAHPRRGRSRPAVRVDPRRSGRRRPSPDRGHPRRTR